VTTRQWHPESPHLITLAQRILQNDYTAGCYRYHLPPLTSYKFVVLILFSVLAFFVQLHYYLELPSVLPVHSTLFGDTLKHTFSKQLFIPPSGKLQRFRCIYVTSGALCLFMFYLLIYLLICSFKFTSALFSRGRFASLYNVHL